METSRLVLRPYESHDWEHFSALVRDAELMRPLSGSLTPEAARSLFDRLIEHDPATGMLGWAVCMKATETYCGHVFIRIHEHEAELGFVLMRRFHGQRLAAEMAAAALEYARNGLGCETVSATVDEDNERSKAVLERIGMSVTARESDAAGEYLVFSDRPRS